MKQRTYLPPEAEVILVRIEEHFLVSNQDFEEKDDDIFGDGNN